MEQRNKFSVGETIEVMKPNGDNIEVTVQRILDEEGNAQESAPHPKQVLYIDLGHPLDTYDILRRKEEEDVYKSQDLARIVARYSGPIKLHIVNFTDIQLYIYDQCPHEELTIIMRRYMMKIAEHFAEENRCLGLITGESIGQVASQTMQSLAATNEVCTLPVYRPLIGFDKNEIIAVSEKIGTYETSIQPFEDCCTIFVAKHPTTKPNLNVIKKSETKLQEKIDDLMKTAIDTTETILVEA